MCSRFSGSRRDERVIEQIDLPDREVVGRPPVGVELAELLRRERAPLFARESPEGVSSFGGGLRAVSVVSISRLLGTCPRGNH